jgi:hypothetical protein
VVGLLVVSAMVSLPTAAQSGERITAFYEAHRQVIIVQQVAGALLLVPFLGFAVALDRRARAHSEGGTRWLLLAGLVFAAAEVATNLPPLAVIRALPALELAGLVEASAQGYRVAPTHWSQGGKHASAAPP